MKDKSFKARLTETLAACAMHQERLQFAYDKMKRNFPLSIVSYDQLSAEEISYTDQLIYRFTKLQDTIGQKLFRLILEGLEEDVENMAFIDILNRLEKLEILEDLQQWLILRETRNQVAHEYPFNREDIVDGLNELEKQTGILSGIWTELKAYCNHRFGQQIIK